MYMDAIVHSAVEEICSHGTKGLTLPNLWSKLRPSLTANGLDLCHSVKAAVWTNLLEIPGLQFEVQGGVSYTLERDSSALNSFEECEQMNLTIVAPERLRNNFVGIYDVEASNSSISDVQRRTLERLASARANGITQSELSKEFGMKANNFFYVLKKLESRGLIVRQSTLVRTKDANGNVREPNNGSCVMTNMLYLHRYAKHLGCQKRLEITKDDTSDVADESRKEDVNVKDFLPALKAVCDKLDEAEGKVLVVSDIKKDLNYVKEKGHKDWRILCSKLKEAQVVEEFLAKVKNKEVCCLRLLKKFSPLHFEAAKSCGSGGNENADGDQCIKLGKRKMTEQVVELTIEQQIYDLIDSAGSKGLTISDITTRLGLRNKQYYERLLQFFSRQGMPIRAESHNRGVAYRVWTSNNFNSVNTDIVLHNSVSLLDKNVQELGESVDTLASKDNAIVVYGVGVEPEAKNMLVSVDSSSNCDSEPSGSRPSGLDVGTVSATPSDVTSLEVSPSAATPTSRRRRQSDIRYPCLALPNVQREQRILKMLDEEKFMAKAEIHRRLEDLEKEKGTNLDKRTLERCLNKLQTEGRCKCIVFQVPTVTNIGSNRLIDMVLHPSTNGESTEVLSQKILERIRSFDILVRRNCYSQLKKGSQVPVLDDIQRIPSSLKMDNLAEQGEARRANGYIPARMVQTKLFHIFLWKHLHECISSEDMESDPEKPHRTWRLFELNDTVKAMPFELYLKIIGSPERSDNLIEKCRKGLRLSDLPLQEYRCLMDTRATGRLSWLINFLRRMRLIRFVSIENGDDKDNVHKTALTHALELRPYIEEPVSVVASSGLSLKDLRPHMRHDFVLSTIEAVEEYWGILEYCYADTNSEAALHAFPGSAVPELFRFKAWCSGISAAQRTELLKRVVVSDPRDKLSFKECKEIASNLDLTLGQVLRVYRSKRHRLTTRLMGDSNAKGEDNLVLKRTQVSASRKRKRSNEQSSLSHSKSAREDLDDEMESPQEQDTSKDENNPEMHQDAIFSLKSGRNKKFAWTEAADRLLIIEYVKHRAVLGPNIHRTEWSSLQNVPAPRDYCRRRMASLNKCLLFRKALMRLCNLLADRYKKHLVMVREHASLDRSADLEFGKRWDDFNQNDLKIALGDVLSCKKLAKLDSPSKAGSDEAPDDDACLPDMDLAPPICAKKRKLSARRSNSQYFPQHYSSVLSKTTPYGSKVRESIAVSNAVELFKLILLSTSTSPEALSVLTETLRRYSQHDLYTAFSYLRERNAMIGGSGSKPYALSKLFLQSAYLSPFPVNTGKRASNFASWVEEREKELVEEGLDLPADLQCGDIFNICALVSSGELSVIPCLPEEGVGEVDSKALKRDNESGETCDGANSKKTKTLTTYEIEISRREKGFPNIRLLLNRVRIPRLHALNTFIDKSLNQVPGEVDQGNPRNLLAGQNYSFGTGNIVETAIDIDKSPWDAMCSYAEQLTSASFDGDTSRPFRPELFKSICLAIHKSGDQGLSMKEILKLLDSTEEKVAEIVVEVLETFSQALKVPAYDSIKFVAPLYRSKYTLTPVPAKADENRGSRYMNPERTIGDELCSVSIPSHEDGGISTMNEARKNSDVVHRVTILNHPKEVVDSSTETLVNPFGEPQTFSHILPWLNADGTTNELVYKGLTRRLLGIVMQNPGIMEDNIILKMNFVNPQSCRKLLKMMILDNHIIVRQRHQLESAEPPSILSSLLKSHKEKSKLMYRDHFFANPMSTALL